MHTLSYWINSLANILNAVSRWVLIVAGITMSIIVFLQVFLRFTFQIPFPWSEESARYLMIWMGMVGSAVALRHARHIGVTILVDRLPGPVHRIVIPLAESAMIVFLVVLVRVGLKLAIKNFTQFSPAMSLPMFYPYLAVPVGCALMILELLASMLHQFFPTAAGENRRQLSTSETPL